VRYGTPQPVQIASGFTRIISPVTVTPGQTVSDDFNGAVGSIWTANSGGVSSVDGRGRIPVGTGFESFQTAATYTILGGSAFARLYPPAAGGASTDANLGFVINSTTSGTSLSITINQVAGTIKFASESGFFDAAAVSITYNSTSHAWVRIRESAGTTYFETSPDCATWTARKTITTPAWVTSTPNQSYQFVGHRDSGTVDYAEIDNFNVAPQAALYTRVEFGAHAGTEPFPFSDHDALEAQVAARLRRTVWFQNMDVAWLDTQAAAAAAQNHVIEIAWDTGAAVTMSAILAGTWDATLDAFFQKAKAYPGTVVLRMWWEMNTTAGRYTMGYTGSDKTVTSLAQWKSAWQYVYNRAKVTNGTTNVRFFYCANGSDVGAYTVEDYYPGSAYVDEIGFNTYNETTFSSWTKFDAKLGPMYKRVTALHTTAPVTIGEIGSVESAPAGTSKAAWSTEMFTSWSFPRLTQINLFNVDQTGTGGNNWKVDSSPASLAVYQQYLPLAVNGTPILQSAAVSMAGAGTLTVTGKNTTVATVGMSGTGTLTVAPLVTHPATVGMSGAGALTVAGTDTTSSAVSMSGAGSLTVAPLVTRGAAVAMAGTGTLAVTAAVTEVATVSMLGSGALTVTGSITKPAAVVFSGSGALTVTGTDTITPSVTVTGAGTLTVAAAVTRTGTITMTGAGALTVTGTDTISSAVTMTGAGALTVTGSTSGVNAVNMTGTGTLTVTGKDTISATVSMTGAGVLTVTGTPTHLGTVTMTGAGALTVAPSVTVTPTLAMTGTGTLTVTTAITHPAAVTLAGVGVLTITTSGSQTAAVTMTGSGALTVGALVTHPATVTLAGAGTLTITSTTTAVGTIQVVGAGTLTIGGTLTHPATIVMSGVGALTVVGSAFPSFTIPRNPVAVLVTNKAAVYLTVNTAGVALDVYDYRANLTTNGAGVALTQNSAEAVLT
jgi:beta-mannanase